MITLLVALAAAQAVPSYDAGRTLPLAPGHWRYVSDAAGGSALLDGQLEFRCDRARRIVTLRRPNQPAAGSQTIVTDTRTGAIPASGEIAARDSLLDSIAFSRGRFLLVSGRGTLAFPTEPEIARSIEDCRN